jgi:hypothetical protein
MALREPGLPAFPGPDGAGAQQLRNKNLFLSLPIPRQLQQNLDLIADLPYHRLILPTRRFCLILPDYLTTR